MPQGIGHNDLKKRLAAAPIFSECSGRQLDAVARQVDVREVEAGAVLAEQGAAGTASSGSSTGGGGHRTAARWRPSSRVVLR